jgi:hypothetical protein
VIIRHGRHYQAGYLCSLILGAFHDVDNIMNSYFSHFTNGQKTSFVNIRCKSMKKRRIISIFAKDLICFVFMFRLRWLCGGI